MNDHSAANNIINIYRKNAKNFDDTRTRSLFEKPWLEKFKSYLPDQHGHVLDLGCGSGEPIAKYFIESDIAVTGIDASSEMIDICADRFSDVPTCRWIVADMREISLDQKFDGILAWNSFFHLNHDDQRAMFKIFENHAKSGAPLMFTAGPDFGVAVNPLWDEPLYHSSLSQDQYENLMKEHSFKLLDVKIEDPECAGHTIYLAQKI